MFGFSGNTKWTLKDLSLHKEENSKWHTYYLTAVYEVENESGIYELTIPKIDLPVRNGIPDMTVEHNWYGEDHTEINLGFGDLELLHDSGRPAWFAKCVKEKTHELTMAEIEKKLGYKIKIVSEKK